MTHDIVRKLTDVLNYDLNSEMQIVYVMAEIRKVLEREKLGKRYPSLTFHCCWALHTRAKGMGADRILKRFDDAQPYYPDFEFGPPEVLDSLGRTMALASLKADLSRFLRTFNLPTKLVDEFTSWLTFLQVYFRVVDDCRFKLSSTATFSLQHIKEILVMPMPIEVHHTKIVFGSLWKVFNEDDKEIARYPNFFTELVPPQGFQSLVHVSGPRS